MGSLDRVGLEIGNGVSGLLKEGSNKGILCEQIDHYQR